MKTVIHFFVQILIFLLAVVILFLSLLNIYRFIEYQDFILEQLGANTVVTLKNREYFSIRADQETISSKDNEINPFQNTQLGEVELQKQGINWGFTNQKITTTITRTPFRRTTQVERQNGQMFYFNTAISGLENKIGYSTQITFSQIDSVTSNEQYETITVGTCKVVIARGNYTIDIDISQKSVTITAKSIEDEDPANINVAFTIECNED